ncbi:cytoplasmic protein [Sinomonas atrocyanea]|uniref:cytoplasmic protein n=1 Tax=Sinomonas atrocyanea TaxID=37927 RepID=UPI003D991545
MSDPLEVSPDLYRLVFENDRVRVLEYLDRPGDSTGTHSHPDSVMVTLTGFSRRLTSGGREVEVEMPPFQARWLDAQEHSGTNIGTSETRTLFIELKEPRPDGPTRGRLGPSES